MAGWVASIVAGLAAVLWLLLLIVTDFNGVVTGLGLLGALGLIGQQSLDDPFGTRRGY